MTKKNDNFIMLPTVDVCFKGLMYNPKVRKGFIAALLGADPAAVRETVLLPTALRQEYPDEKLGILDVRALMEDGAQINMEMQAYPFGQWDARSLFYLSKMYTEQIGRGDPYTKLKKCIHVSILDFIRFEDDKKCHRTIRLCDEQTGKKYTDLLEMQILELKKLPEELQNDDEVIRWMRFLAGKNRKELEDMAGTSEYIEEAYRELEG
nr:Rpn family recombination-promoting nuclease/putative transposase [uncultured Lachnoclostridium sp.]